MRKTTSFSLANTIKDMYLKHCHNIVAITVGGSQARGFSDNKSDIEMFIYYTGSIIPKSKIKKVLTDLKATLVRSNDLHFSPFPWGVATCFETQGVKVELVYRDIQSIEKRMLAFVNGNIYTRHGTHDTPFGHYESGVASCLAESEIIYEDRKKLYTKLRKIVVPFPSKLKQKILEYYFLDAYEVLTVKTQTAVVRNDHFLFNSTISFALRAMVIVIFTLNDVYFPGDKWNQKYIDRFKVLPQNWPIFSKAFFVSPELTRADKQKKFDLCLKMATQIGEMLKTRKKDLPSARG